MARSARIHVPGATVHVISRFVDRGFRLAGFGERAVGAHAHIMAGDLDADTRHHLQDMLLKHSQEIAAIG